MRIWGEKCGKPLNTNKYLNRLNGEKSTEIIHIFNLLATEHYSHIFPTFKSRAEKQKINNTSDNKKITIYHLPFMN